MCRSRTPAAGKNKGGIAVKPETVLKIGGSLSRGSGLNALCETISRLGERHRLVVVPGGGAFADQVRQAYRRYALDETSAHKMALLAMDQYGYVLHHLISGSCLTAGLEVACEASKTCVGILLPSSLLTSADSLPHSWQVTSDTIAAWIAQAAHCPRLVLLKDVDGLMASSEVIPELTAVELAQHAGGVDEYLSRFLAGANLETWIINGMHPDRLRELIERDHTLGTRIRV
jgi:aspartokinase-like uncharacterized kinase